MPIHIYWAEDEPPHLLEDCRRHRVRLSRDQPCASRLTPNEKPEVTMVSPALERYTDGPVRGDLWKRPDLSPRDRSIDARRPRRPQPDGRAALLPRPGARQRRQAGRGVRDHHAPRLLLRMGERHVGGPRLERR